MAFGTPVVGTTAYSASGGTSVAPSYPASIVATDQLVMIIGQKPSTANSGTVTTPTGWTLREELTAAGGYGATLGADTGNTNLRIYTKDTVTAGLSGTVSVTVATNGVCWANITRVPTGGGAISYGSADGQRTTTPTSPLSVALTNGASATAFQAGDFAIWAMCIPTDVTTPAQFSAHTVTSSGITFNATAELVEPDSTTGNDIGGYVAWVTVNTGSAGGAPTVGATLAGTLTNVRGPIALLRMREAQALTLDTTPASYSVTGSDVDLTYVRKLTLEITPASYALTGSNVDLTYTPAAVAYDLIVNPASYSVTGSDATLAQAKVLSVTPASYAVTGSNVDLTYVRRLSLEVTPASYAITGSSVDLTYVPATLAYTLEITPASYAVTGSNVNLGQGRVLSITPSNYAVTGSTATLAQGRVLSVTPGSYAITGSSVDLTYTPATAAYLIETTPGSYIITGSSANMAQALVLSVTPASYAVTGSNANLAQARVLSVTPGSYSATGSSVSLVFARVLGVSPESYAYSASNVTLSRGYTLNVDTGWSDDYYDPDYIGDGHYAITGYPVRMQYPRYPLPSEVLPGVEYGPSGDDYVGAADAVSLTAAQRRLLFEIYALHGLSNDPLVVSATGRSAGALTQTVGGTTNVTVSRTAASTASLPSVATMIEELAALHGLTTDLVTTATSRTAGSISQTFSTVGTTTTVTRV